MAQVLIRNIAEDVVERLKKRAESDGVSLEAHLRRLLEREASPSPADVIARIDAIRMRSRPWRPGEPTAVDYVREAREDEDLAQSNFLSTITS